MCVCLLHVCFMFTSMVHVWMKTCVPTYIKAWSWYYVALSICLPLLFRQISCAKPVAHQFWLFLLIRWPSGSLVSASQVLGSHIGNTYLSSFYVGSGHPTLVLVLAGKLWLTTPPQLPTFLKYNILVSWGL